MCRILRAHKPLVIFLLVCVKKMSKQSFSLVKANSDSKQQEFSHFDVSSMFTPFFGDQGAQQQGETVFCWSLT
jgi:hypothetical protein